jgi:hypothetical protein
VRLTSATAATLIGLTSFVFASGQLNFLTNLEKFAETKAQMANYKQSPVLPCYMYFDYAYQMVVKPGTPNAVDLANNELRSNPRCISALIANTRTIVDSGDTANLGSFVYRLYELAPARAETISFGMYYVNRSGDQKLGTLLQAEMKTLGLTYIPGKLG